MATTTTLRVRRRTAVPAGAVSPTQPVDGASVLGTWTADLGTTAIGTIQVGDDAATTAALSVDDVPGTRP